VGYWIPGIWSVIGVLWLFAVLTVPEDAEWLDHAGSDWRELEADMDLDGGEGDSCQDQ
jgi:hypothetical protein